MSAPRTEPASATPIALEAPPLEPPRVEPPPAAQPRPDRGTTTPLSPGHYRVQFTADAATHAKLREAQDLLRREVPDGDVAAIMDRALDRLLEILRRRTARREHPTRATAPAAAPAAPSRHIPAAVRRAVWTRDRGRCAFVGRGGQRCGERAFLEFHHLTPFAAGGATTVANLRLLCRAHNGLESTRWFGARADAWREEAQRGPIRRRATDHPDAAAALHAPG